LKGENAMDAKRIYLSLFLLLCIFATSASPEVSVLADGNNQIFLPIVMKNYVKPMVDITYMHPCRQTGYISGTVENVSPADHKIAVYIYVSGWWNKPYWAAPLTDINPDKTWQTYVTTGGNDTMATKFAAFLVPNGYNPPLIGGSASLPTELYANSLAYDIKERDCPLRSITFSGYTWLVKAAVGPTGPGPNYFTDDVNDVYVDNDGYLHLKIVYRNNRWWCSEVINTANLGYGTYVYKVLSPVNSLDPNAVLGLFTWDDTSANYAHREIDIEYSIWSSPGNQNSQFVIQPYDLSGNIHRFDTAFAGPTTNGFIWNPSHIFFRTLAGDSPFPGNSGTIESWDYTGGSIPVPGNENVRINLWLFNGIAPAGPIEIIIKSFQFIP
jgi:hypothetical protein